MPGGKTGKMKQLETKTADIWSGQELKFVNYNY